MTTSHVVGYALIVPGAVWHRLDAGANRPSSRAGQGGAVVADLVFRRLETPADFSCARRLLGAREPQRADETWFGLWNLTAADGDALAAIAAVRQSSPRVVEVRTIKTNQGYAAQARLLRELADTCRADGVEWLVAAADGTGAEILRRQGFVNAAQWLVLQV
jgi:hypothetical protein